MTPRYTADATSARDAVDSARIASGASGSRMSVPIQIE